MLLILILVSNKTDAYLKKSDIIKPLVSNECFRYFINAEFKQYARTTYHAWNFCKIMLKICA